DHGRCRPSLACDRSWACRGLGGALPDGRPGAVMTGILSIGPSTARFPARKGKVEGRASAEKTVAPGSAEPAAAPRSNALSRFAAGAVCTLLASARRSNALSRFVAGALAHLRLSAGEPHERPLGSVRSRHAALGLPHRRRP